MSICTELFLAHCCVSNIIWIVSHLWRYFVAVACSPGGEEVPRGLKGSKCWFLVIWKRMHARVIPETDARKSLFLHRCAQPERPFWQMHATDFWATDARKVWGKSRMHAIYIPDARNPLWFSTIILEIPNFFVYDPDKSTLTSRP